MQQPRDQSLLLLYIVTLSLSDAAHTQFGHTTRHDTSNLHTNTNGSNVPVTSAAICLEN